MQIGGGMGKHLHGTVVVLRLRGKIRELLGAVELDAIPMHRPVDEVSLVRDLVPGFAARQS
jgi:hypothetical protein